MSQIKTLNGVQYTLPQYNDTAWGANTGNVLTQYLAAIADVTLQLTGGAFTLTADADFGANFGLKALYLKSETANPASAGVVRLAKTDSIGWRNNANGADKLLAIDGSDNLTYAANKVYTAGGAAGIVNADIAVGAAIAYSKLALTGSIVNADIASGAAIAYSKLALTGAILNADLAGSIAYSKLVLTGSIVNGDLTAGTILNTAINASAAIALTKLAAMAGHSKALASDASGFIVESAVTATELGYVSGVTSAIQTQLNATIANPLTGNLAAGSHKITGLANGTAINDALAYGQSLVQIVGFTTTTVTTTSSASWGATSLTVSITPKSASNKILIIVSGVGDNSAATRELDYTIFKNSTTNLGDATKGFGMVFDNGARAVMPVVMHYLDSPATTSATTYTVYVAAASAASVGWGVSTVTQTIYAIEIGA